MTCPKVVRITESEFELDNGIVYPHAVPLDVLPTLEEFQTTYEQMFLLFQQQGLIEADEAVSKHK